VTISFENNELKPDSLPFARIRMNILGPIWHSLRFLGFLALFLLNSKYLVVLMLLVFLILIVERFQIATTGNEEPASPDQKDSDSINQIPGGKSISQLHRQVDYQKLGQRRVKPRIRLEKELKDREYEKKIEEIFKRIRESGIDEYQNGISEIQELLIRRQENLSKEVITKALR